MKLSLIYKKPETDIGFRIPKSESGFTLVELMVATAIAMMIIGSVYAAFRSSLKVYQRDETRIIMLQRCRTALDRMAHDLNNLFYVEDDDELTLLVQDYADSETTVDKDMISFVAIITPRLDEYMEALESAGGVIEEEEENQLPSDLARIVYYVGPSPEDQTVQSLMRIETPNLDIEELETMMSEIQGSALSDEMLEELRSAILVDYVDGLNIRYYDGTDWVDEWDMEQEQALPRAVEITLSITDANNKGKNLTEAIVIYLPFSSSEEEADQMIGGAQQPGMMQR